MEPARGPVTREVSRELLVRSGRFSCGRYSERSNVNGSNDQDQEENSFQQEATRSLYLRVACPRRRWVIFPPNLFATPCVQQATKPPACRSPVKSGEGSAAAACSMTMKPHSTDRHPIVTDQRGATAAPRRSFRWEMGRPAHQPLAWKPTPPTTHPALAEGGHEFVYFATVKRPLLLPLPPSPLTKALGTYGRYRMSTSEPWPCTSSHPTKTDATLCMS